MEEYHSDPLSGNFTGDKLYLTIGGGKVCIVMCLTIALPGYLIKQYGAPL